jgi:hypothetical protein
MLAAVFVLQETSFLQLVFGSPMVAPILEFREVAARVGEVFGNYQALTIFLGYHALDFGCNEEKLPLPYVYK